jgi:uncharacterized protein (TIGR00730 family)
MKAICVYCGSNPGRSPIYQDTARELGLYFAINDIKLIYGGSDLGLMGALANSVLDNGGKVTAVITADLKARSPHDNSSELIIVDTMHQRKQKMSELADAFIAMPGGFGTLDEMFEMLTWRQLGYHSKSCGFLNVNMYFYHLLLFLNESSREGFLKKEHRPLAFFAESIEGMMEEFHRQRR